MVVEKRAPTHEMRENWMARARDITVMRVVGFGPSGEWIVPLMMTGCGV